MRTRPIKGIVLPVTGPSREDEFFDFRDFQAAVEGLIEPVKLSDGSTMYVNEEGLVHDLPPNTFAADVCGLGGRSDLLMYGIRGNVVIVGPLDDDGYSTDVTDKVRGWIQRVERERRPA